MISRSSLAHAVADLAAGVVDVVRHRHTPPTPPPAPVVPRPRQPVDHALPGWHPSPDVREELSDPYLHALVQTWAGGGTG